MYAAVPSTVPTRVIVTVSFDSGSDFISESPVYTWEEIQLYKKKCSLTGTSIVARGPNRVPGRALYYWTLIRLLPQSRNFSTARRLVARTGRKRMVCLRAFPAPQERGTRSSGPTVSVGISPRRARIRLEWRDHARQSFGV
jgi:hypothetical protein